MAFIIIASFTRSGLKDDNNQVSQWLSEHQLDNLSRLGQEIKVDEQWEKALEIVLNDLMMACA